MEVSQNLISFPTLTYCPSHSVTLPFSDLLTPKMKKSFLMLHSPHMHTCRLATPHLGSSPSLWDSRVLCPQLHYLRPPCAAHCSPLTPPHLTHPPPSTGAGLRHDPICFPPKTCLPSSESNSGFSHSDHSPHNGSSRRRGSYFLFSSELCLQGQHNN